MAPLPNSKPKNKIVNIGGRLFVEKPNGERRLAKPHTVEKFKHLLTVPIGSNQHIAKEAPAKVFTPKQAVKLVKKGTAIPVKKKPTLFRPRVKSRHPTHSPLRSKLPLLPFRATIRLGSTTADNTSTGPRIVVNEPQAINNSANKKLMKQCFDAGNVRTAMWCMGVQSITVDNILQKLKMEEYSPIVSKLLTGSRGRGNKLHRTQSELEDFLNKNAQSIHNYIFERFHDYNREYRLHVTKKGCFYTCRKLLKENTPDDKRWFRNDSNSTWAVETNPSFDKPVNWNDIVAECVKALNAVGLDVGACDVKVQSAKDGKGNKRTNPEFIIIEINSAPSFGEITTQKYLEVIPEILKAKHNAAG